MTIEKPVPVKYKIEKTATGMWRKHTFLEGGQFKEFISNREINGVPLIHIVSGMHPETRKAARARGVIGIGQFASGFLAIGQFASGYLAIGQFSMGRIAAIGQFALAPISIGQFAGGVVSIGQTTIAAIGLTTMGLFFFDGSALSAINLGKLFF